MAPFKSSKQQRLCYRLKAQGKNGTWDCEKWSAETDQKTLKKKKKKFKRTPKT